MGTGKVKVSDFVILGFAFFASYFGAGNLIFPPKIGQAVGDGWLAGMGGLAVSACALPIIALIILGTTKDVDRKLAKIHPKFFGIFLGIGYFFGCMCIAIPRTAAVGISVGLNSITSAVPYIVALVVYFVIVVYFSWNEGKALEKIGKILTPLMVVILVFITIKAFVDPIGAPTSQELELSPLNFALLQGYQTGDAVVSMILASFFFAGVRAKGYKDEKTFNKVVWTSGFLAFLLLAIVYGGLLYLGACTGTEYPADIDNATLLLAVVGRVGGTVLLGAFGLAALLACITTAVSQVSTVASFLAKITKGKIKYTIGVLIVSIFAFLVATLGLSTIVSLAAPVFGWLYSVTLSMLIILLLDRFLPNSGGHKIGMLLVVIEAVLELGANYGLPFGFIFKIPLAAQGFGWVCPLVIGLIVGEAVWAARGIKNDEVEESRVTHHLTPEKVEG